MGVVPLKRRVHNFYLRRINSPLHYVIQSCRGEFIRQKQSLLNVEIEELHPKIIL